MKLSMVMRRYVLGTSDYGKDCPYSIGNSGVPRSKKKPLLLDPGYRVQAKTGTASISTLAVRSQLDECLLRGLGTGG